MSGSPTVRVAPPVLGMVLFIASETMFFGGLFAAYSSLRASQAQWPPTGAPAPELALASVATLLLITSSFTQHRAAHAQAKDLQTEVRKWLTMTIVLGAAFLAIQGWEWAQLVHEGLRVGNDAYGTTFFTLTGAHGLHVIGGLGVLCVAGARMGVGTPQCQAGLFEAATYYWHFVDAVWLVVFTALYLAI